MRPSRFSEEQVLGILKEHKAAERTTTLCRRHGISEQTLYRWKSKYVGPLEISFRLAYGPGVGRSNEATQGTAPFPERPDPQTE